MKRMILLLALALTLFQAHALLCQSQQKSETLTTNRFAFGVNYVPYYSGEWYQVSEELGFNPAGHGFLPFLFNNSVRFTELQGYFSYFLLPKVSLNITLGYNGVYQKENYEMQKQYPPYDSSHLDQHYGYDYTSAVNQFLMRMDIRYYLRSRLPKKVAPFIQTGFGKYFAEGDNSSKYWDALYEVNEKFESNEKDFTREMNSPFVMDFGFGAEYYFNASLALHASAVAFYTHRSATAKFHYRNDSYTSYWQRKFTRNDWQTQIGIGLTFLF